MPRGRISSYSPHTPDVISVSRDMLNQDPTAVRSARISAVYREERRPVKVNRSNTVGDADSLREQVLRMSLFPNVFNRTTILTSG
jgi:hypothetical protein